MMLQPYLPAIVFKESRRTIQRGSVDSRLSCIKAVIFSLLAELEKTSVSFFGICLTIICASCWQNSQSGENRTNKISSAFSSIPGSPQIISDCFTACRFSNWLAGIFLALFILYALPASNPVANKIQQIKR